MNKDTLLSIGEALIDFIPSQTGCEFNEVKSFSPLTGGAPANVCGAFTRLGGKSRIITQLGCDPFGKKIKDEFDSYGIDTSCICFTPQANTALAFVSLTANGDRTFSFYRNPSADMLMDKNQIKENWFADAYALHFCSVSLGNFPMRDAHKAAIEYAKANNSVISFDPNLRFQLWNDTDALKNTVREFIPHADILKISDEELEFITGTADMNKAVNDLFECGVKLIIYTCGSNGAYAFTPTSHAFAPAYKVKAVDTTGAGDGFIGSFLWYLKSLNITRDTLSVIPEDMLLSCLQFSNRFCALSVQSSGAIASYPDLASINI